MFGTSRSTPEARQEFLAYLRSIGPGDECIRWPWAKGEAYGGLRFEGRNVGAHCWVYEQINGPLDGMSVLHSCDNRPCVRPSHLRAGTQSDNLRDAVLRGRHKVSWRPKFGESNPNAILTAVHVRTIRSRVAAGEPQIRLAEEMNISPQQVSRIVRGERWGGVSSSR